MGYGYGQNGLACDNCGVSGGVRKRTCPYKVLGDNLRCQERYPLPYCPAPALCNSCYGQLGGLRGVHGDSCKEGAATMQAEADAIQALLDAGEKLVVSASGDWKAGVPKGLVEVTFSGPKWTNHETLLVPKEQYDPQKTKRLSEYRAMAVAA